ncbi:MAG: tetrahydrofolate dehydrogenase/cyclohydrolase catalytic domain-containing protein [Planctomycetota bacterium]
MTARIISGTEIRESILEEIATEVDRLRAEHDTVPGLVVIRIGDDPASVSYVKLKSKTAQRLGFHQVEEFHPEDTSEARLLELIAQYNADPKVHGILVQLPLPRHFDEEKVLLAIDPDKDVDGFHPVNAGRLLIGEDVRFPPCTPAGIQEMLRRAGVTTEGAEIVVVGRSNIVGKPVAVLLMQKGETANATVTVVHTRTVDMAAHCRRADILIVAAGRPGLVQPEWIKPGACVIDVGVNRIGEKISPKTGKKVADLQGDVDFERAREIAGWITPVPGGVGPMTIAMLMRNTLRSLQLSLGQP